MRGSRPTWPIQTWSSSTRATVIVVPIPETDSSPVARSYTLRFASSMSPTTSSLPVRPSASARPTTAAASREASSPAWAPPMPSAIANSGGSHTNASSF